MENENYKSVRQPAWPLFTALAATFFEFPAVDSFFYPDPLISGLLSSTTPEQAIFGLTAIAFTGVFAARGIGNIAKSYAIITNSEDGYYKATDRIRQKHPILGGIFLPMNLNRTRKLVQAR